MSPSRPSALRRWMLIGIVALVMAGAGAWVATKRIAPAAPTDFAVATLLAQTLPDPGGKSVNLERYRGRVLVVNFWATWCPPCVEEMPELSTIAREYAARGVEVLGIGVDLPGKIAQFAAKRPTSYQLLVADKTGYELSRQFGNRSLGLPYTVVIDPRGRVAKRILGRFNGKELRSALDAALAD